MAVRLLVALSSALLSACAGHDTVIAVGERIHHDDFEYSVQHVQRANRVGEVAAHGQFCIVMFQVENRARRVEHGWGNDVAYLVDEEGRRYENDGQAQKALNAANPFGYKDWHATPAGAVETTVMVFDLPADVKDAYLKVRGWPLMGDVFDLNQYQRTKVKLF
jgi:hypothetical protein